MALRKLYLTQLRYGSIDEQMKATTLDKIVENWDTEIPDALIGMKLPWANNQVCLIIEMPQDFLFPSEAKENGYTYFLELSSVRDLIELGIEHGLSQSKLVELIYFYAQNDAYPEWLYD